MSEQETVRSVFQQLSSNPVGIHVHDVIIKGDTKRRDELIEVEVVDLLRDAPTVQDLLRVASISNERISQLDMFDAIKITLDVGPLEFPSTTNVIIEVANPSRGAPTSTPSPR